MRILMTIKKINNIALVSASFLLLAACNKDEVYEPPYVGEPNPAPIYSNYFSDIYQNYRNNKTIDGDYLLMNWISSGYKAGIELPVNMNLPIIHVKDFGAVPDNGQDDIVYIQQAIDEAERLGGGVVVFEPGQYDLNINDTGETFAKKHALWIESDNVYLKGYNNGKDKTILKQWKVIDTDSELNDAVRSPHTVNFSYTGTSPGYGANYFSEDVKAGSSFIPLTRVDDIQVGDFAYISLMSWKPPRDDNPALEEHVLYPLYSDGLDERNTPLPYRPFEIFRRITDKNEHGVYIDVPLPRDFSVEHNAVFYKNYPQMSNCGIRDIAIHGSHDGSYIEGGYNFGGINFSKVSDCWAENIEISSVLLDISFNSSRNVTVRNVKVYGSEGHHGIGFYSSFNNLVENVHYYGGRKNHMISFNRNSTGNVARNFYNTAEIVNPNVGSAIDFHSGYSSFNLLENINKSHIASSGGKNGNSSSGQYNTIWNLSHNVHLDKNEDTQRLFQYCWYQSVAYNGPFKGRKYCHRRHPRTIYVGISAYDEESTVLINDYQDDVINEWMYIEGLNKGDIYPRSLYEGQKYKDYNTHPELKGADSIVLKIGEVFEPLKGVSAISELYGDITQDIVVTGEVDTTYAHKTQVEYQVIDSLGLATTIKRNVEVR